MIIDEPIDVELTSAGAPIRFTWRGVVYGVVSRPEPWLARREWWRESSRAPRGAGRALLETERWRVDAVPLTDGRWRLDGCFDLAGSPAAGIGWRLAAASGDGFDEALFA